MTDALPLFPGTLDLLVLRALHWEPTHGTGVAEWIRVVTSGTFDVEEGSLYPALYRLVRSGLIEVNPGRSDHNRPARFYQLTPAGRQRLKVLAANWERYQAAVSAALGHGTPRLWAAT